MPLEKSGVSFIVTGKKGREQVPATLVPKQGPGTLSPPALWQRRPIPTFSSHVNPLLLQGFNQLTAITYQPVRQLYHPHFTAWKLKRSKQLGPTYLKVLLKIIIKN